MEKSTFRFYAFNAVLITAVVLGFDYTEFRLTKQTQAIARVFELRLDELETSSKEVEDSVNNLNNELSLHNNLNRRKLKLLEKSFSSYYTKSEINKEINALVNNDELSKSEIRSISNKIKKVTNISNENDEELSNRIVQISNEINRVKRTTDRVRITEYDDFSILEPASEKFKVRLIN